MLSKIGEVHKFLIWTLHFDMLLIFLDIVYVLTRLHLLECSREFHEIVYKYQRHQLRELSV